MSNVVGFSVLVLNRELTEPCLYVEGSESFPTIFLSTGRGWQESLADYHRLLAERSRSKYGAYQFSFIGVCWRMFILEGA